MARERDRGRVRAASAADFDPWRARRSADVGHGVDGDAVATGRPQQDVRPGVAEVDAAAAMDGEAAFVDVDGVEEQALRLERRRGEHDGAAVGVDFALAGPAWIREEEVRDERSAVEVEGGLRIGQIGPDAHGARRDADRTVQRRVDGGAGSRVRARLPGNREVRTGREGALAAVEVGAVEPVCDGLADADFEREGTRRVAGGLRGEGGRVVRFGADVAAEELEDAVAGVADAEARVIADVRQDKRAALDGDRRVRPFLEPGDEAPHRRGAALLDVGGGVDGSAGSVVRAAAEEKSAPRGRRSGGVEGEGAPVAEDDAPAGLLVAAVVAAADADGVDAVGPEGAAGLDVQDAVWVLGSGERRADDRVGPSGAGERERSLHVQAADAQDEVRRRDVAGEGARGRVGGVVEIERLRLAVARDGLVAGRAVGGGIEAAEVGVVVGRGEGAAEIRGVPPVGAAGGFVPRARRRGRGGGEKNGNEGRGNHGGRFFHGRTPGRGLTVDVV